MTNEQTLVLIKPDGLVKSLTGDILSKLSETELKIVGVKIVAVERDLAEEHYRHLKDKPFFDELIQYIMGEFHTRRVLAMVYEGDNAVIKVRRIVGSTNPEEADPISIRGKYGRITTSGVYENAVHCSENPSEAEREIKLWFEPHEVSSPLFPVLKREVTKEHVTWK
jgi:nucleoside-diphosphate kinase